jgi:hypothetical protein
MGRLLQAAVLLASAVGVANAGPKGKVKVETTPPGATVYVDDIENGAACAATPCTVDVPVGEHSIIVRLDKYSPDFKSVTVKAGKKPIPLSFKLSGAFGTIKITAPKGASVKVNDEDKGKVGGSPLEVEAPAEPVTVIITYNGKSQTEFVDVPENDTVPVKFKGGAAAAAVDNTDEEESSGGGDIVADIDDEDDGGDPDVPTDGPSDGGETGTSPAPALPMPFIEAGLAMDIAFRRFKFDSATDPQPFNNGGQVVLGPAIEFWPGRLVGSHFLRGLSIFARVQFGINAQEVTRDSGGMIIPVGAQTLWGALEASVRHKWVFANVLGVEASGGFIRDQAEFNANSQAILDMVPSADYKSIRIGGRLSYVAKFEPYVLGENRVVLDGGELATRGNNAKASGYRVALGLRTMFGPIAARAEFSYAGYSWTYSSSSGSSPPSASDTIMWLGFSLGYTR